MKTWSIISVMTLFLLVVGSTKAGSASAGDDLLRKYESGDLEFNRVEIGDLVVYYHLRTIGEATVEGDHIVYHFDEESEELLNKITHWRSDLPDHVLPVISSDHAESMVRGEVRFSRLYIISPESHVFPLEKTPHNPCWVVRSVHDGEPLVTIVDAVDGIIVGYGVPPPYEGFSLSGPWYFGPCSGSWTSWYQNAASWFNAMGYSTEEVEWPTEATVRGHIRSCWTAMFYELAHGGSSSFAGGCLGGTSAEYTTATEIGTWIADYSKMPFAFIGSCEGMCYTGPGSFSYEFRKGSAGRAVTVGYCHMAEPHCDDAWSYSVEWQNAMFHYMSQGYTVRDAFDQAHADYPMCGDCMQFAGDEEFAVVPLVARNGEPVLSHGYVTPEAGTSETIFTYRVSFADVDGDMPHDAYVYIDGEPHEMFSYPPGDSLFFCETTNSVGSHDYYFSFGDGCETCRLPDSGVFIGPAVTHQFVRGDSDADGDITLFDGLRIFNWLGGSASSLPCLNAADAQDDEDVDIFDAIRVLNWLGGVAPPPPPPCCGVPGSCGPDPTPGGLTCELYLPCAAGGTQKGMTNIEP